MKVSVVTVCYNCDATIADTIGSVNAQSYPNVEHLIIDGQSTDKTIEIVRANMNPKLILRSEPDNGIYDAMNKGLALASGDVVGFLNADDLYADADVIQRIVTAFDDEAVEVCFGDLVYVSQDNSKVLRNWKSSVFVAGSFSRAWAPPHPTFYIRRSALNRMGGFDLSYQLAADNEFMMRYLECDNARSAYIPQVLVRMRVGGVSNRSMGNVLRQNYEILMALKRHGLSHSIALFIACKLLSRWKQRQLN